MYNNDYLFNQNPVVTQPNGFESWLGAATGAVVVLIVLLALICIAVAVLMIVADCKIYAKAGEKWWKALIPGYSTWVLTKITGLAWWWFLIIMGLTALEGDFNKTQVVIPTLVFLTYFNYNFNLAKKFGKTNGFAVLLSLLPVIGYPILAFGSAKYEKDAKVDKNGIFSIEK